MPEHLQFDTLPSSNDKLLRLADTGAEEHTLVVARRQTQARGGRGPWHAPVGGLWFSTLWEPGIDACEAALITLAAGWGVREGVRRATGIAAGLKWPNDLIVDGRKLAGVVVEGRVEGHDVAQAVVGVGINVNNPVHELPEEVAETATSLQAESGRDLDLEELLDHVIQSLMEARDLLDDPEEIVANVHGCWTQKGQAVSVDTGYAMLEGTALRINPDGVLVLETEAGGEHRVEDPSLAKFVRVV